MKKNYLLTLIPFLFFTGCSSNEANNDLSNRMVYSDNAIITEDELTISFSELKERKGYNLDTYSTSFEMSLLSSNPKQVEYKIYSPKFVRESNDAEYSVDSFYFNPKTVTLECDIAKTLSFSTTLPTSITEENYYFTFKDNTTTYKFCLYETPDELRAKYNVKFVVDGNEEYTKEIAERKKLSNYDWVSSDYVYGCNVWYSDPNFTTKITDSFVVNSNITVYGKKQTILKYKLSDVTNTAYVNGYNFVPSTGEIVIPKVYDGRSIFGIMAGSFMHDIIDMKSIYFPKKCRILEYNYFSNCTDLETVYYEGNEEEWNSINQGTFKDTVTFVFNTYK